MLIGHEVVSFPMYVFTHYENFISVKELILLGHLQAQPRCGKKSWEIVAQRMGYKTITPIGKAIDSMVERGLVTRKAYDVDGSKFHQSCYDMWEKAEVELAKPKEKKVKERKPEYTIAYGIQKEFKDIPVHQLAGQVKLFLNGDISEQDTFKIFMWSQRYLNLVSDGAYPLRTAIKPFVGANIPEDDFKAFLTYLTSWYKSKSSDGQPVKKPFTSDLTMENYNRWVDGGRKTVFMKAGKVNLDEL